MPDYDIKKPCRPDGNTYRESGTVTLTERQARYLVLSGHLAEVTPQKKAK
ncbi:hypothetical protein DSLASN_02480 [Desulfoluna limicola]|uniref:Uncharacterized protein n=1 Tax=Desulfoluna limicola TaxID=2810562 RepID=A0ABM7PAG1_9BACT|nr:hypothetical protein [Desulfoluna limicola]BCS94616.1 hypothetical protein DSLASN_02480 [Desulfoluna limicola]